MNINLETSFTTLLPKLLAFSLNFIDDFLCFLLSHLGIHVSWLQFLGYGLIAGKVIYWLSKYTIKPLSPTVKTNSSFL